MFRLVRNELQMSALLPYDSNSVCELPRPLSFVLFPAELCPVALQYAGKPLVSSWMPGSTGFAGAIAGSTVLTTLLSLGLIGAMAGLAVVFRRLRRSEKQRAIQDMELRRASRLLRNAAQSRTELLTELGHEIRNPLSGIMGLTHAVEETSLTAPQREFIAAIRRCVRLLEEAVSKTLTSPPDDGAQVGAEANGPGTARIHSVMTAAPPSSLDRTEAKKASADNSPNPGSRPAPAPEKSTLREEKRLADADPKIGRSTRKALVIEDIDYNAIATQAMLRAVGVDSEIASNGPAALERLQTCYYDLALMDWNLPGLMGTEVVKRFRASEAAGQRRLIIGTSAYTAESDRQACLDAGMDAFIPKPLSPEKIAATLRTIPEWSDTTCLTADKSIAVDESAAVDLDLKLLIFLSDRASGGLVAQIDRYLVAADSDREGAHAAVASRDSRRILQQAHRLLAHADAVKYEPLAELAARLQSEAAAMGDEHLRSLLGQIDQAFAGLRNKLDSIRASTGRG